LSKLFRLFWFVQIQRIATQTPILDINPFTTAITPILSVVTPTNLSTVSASTSYTIGGLNNTKLYTFITSNFVLDYGQSLEFNVTYGAITLTIYATSDTAGESSCTGASQVYTTPYRKWCFPNKPCRFYYGQLANWLSSWVDSRNFMITAVGSGTFTANWVKTGSCVASPPSYTATPFCAGYVNTPFWSPDPSDGYGRRDAWANQTSLTILASIRRTVCGQIPNACVLAVQAFTCGLGFPQCNSNNLVPGAGTSHQLCWNIQTISIY
jgi:hypothetical protein